MRKLSILVILTLSCGGGDTAPQGPEDIRRSLRTDWRDNMICYREQDWCACCYGSNTAYCYNGHNASFTFAPCKVPEKMGLRIY